jgi:CRP-like cAMP-binding protein
MVAVPPGNRLLDALPAAERERLAGLVRIKTMDRGEATTQAESMMQCVDFPISALMSVTGLLENGTTFEIASVGPEGFVEVDAALEAQVALRSAVCSFPGEAVRMSVETFQMMLSESRPFARLVRRAARARLFVTEQNSMCNLRHSIVARLARWLLVASERLHRRDFPVTHDLLATILGTRRAGVSEAAAELQQRGAIEYQRGLVAIGNEDRLAEASCECYEACKAAIEESLAETGEG